MNSADLNEAIAVANTVLTGLLGTLQGKTGVAGAQVRYQCGLLQANGAAELAATATSKQFWLDMIACFEAAQQAGASFETMDSLRDATEALVVVSPAATAVKNFCVRLSLVELSRILAATQFTSRQDIDAYFDRMNASFGRAELIAADNHDNVSYRLLIQLHAAVSNDLANRARPLPRMVQYSFPASKPSLWLSQRLYYDPSRNDELIAENKPIHPLFMPSTGNALAD